MTILDPTGMRHGKLVVTSFTKYNRGIRLHCVCDCGKERSFAFNEVLGARPSFAACNLGGCRQVLVFHGHKRAKRKSPEYSAWLGAKNRTTNERCPKFSEYGGRGIKMCERWAVSFEAFLADMGPRPSPSHSLDRIDVDGDYEPGNCRWATQKEQQRNRQNNRILEIAGRSQNVTAWAEEVGLPPGMIFLRLRRGWSPEKAVFHPRVGGVSV